jgi:hypothetical protein
MSETNTTLQLTLVGRAFSLTPLPGYRDSICTAADSCGCRATHRLLSRRTASVELLCDQHTLVWSREQGLDVPMGGIGAP